MRINNNIAALRSFHSIRKANKDTEASMIRLSKGYKINSSKDDAAGLAISNKMKLQIAGLDKANQNTMDGVSIVQTADGALSEVHNMLQRMRELAVKASTDTLEDDDRNKIQDEIDSLLQEIDDISMRTEFNSIKLFGPKLNGVNGMTCLEQDGSFTDKLSSSYVSPGMPDCNLNMPLTSRYKYKINLQIPEGKNISITDSIFFINAFEVKFDASDTYETAMSKMKYYLDIAGCKTAYDPDSRTLEIFSNNNNISIGHVFSGSGVSFSTFYNWSNNKDVFLEGKDITVTTIDGAEISIKESIVRNNQLTVTLDHPYIGMQAIFDLNQDVDTPFETEGGIIVQYRDYSSIIVQTGPNKDMEVSLDIAQINPDTLGIEDMAYLTFNDSQKALISCDKAIAMVSRERSKLGAYQNRLEYAVSSLNGTQDNMEMALSRIMDTDMAKEMTTYTQHNIISQTGVSILAQANQRPQQILQLVGR